MTRNLAATLLLLSLLPVANWIPQGETDAGYAARLTDWLLGLALCVGVGALVAFVTRGRGASVVAATAPMDERAERRGLLALSAVLFVVYVVIALLVFSGRPLLIDEIVQVLQAQDLAAGRLTHSVPADMAFFSILNEVDAGARAYGQYPVGGPAMLVPGVWIGAPWVVGPIAGVACVLLFWMLLRDVEADASSRFRLAATALFGIAPFAAFMFGSHMNHTTVLAWILAAMVALTRAVRREANLAWGFAAGCALGAAATIRPLDALAFALPGAVWLLWEARRGGAALRLLLLSGLGVSLPLLLLLWSNRETTGHPFTFGYDLLWGSGHRLGFHSTPWGPVHTPARGLELIGQYLARLNTYLFEVPFPSLLLPALGLWTWRRPLAAADRYLLVSAGLLAVGYWAYWHDGFYLGPRFLFAWMPALALWSARGLRALDAAATATPAVRRGLRAAALAAVAYAALTIAVVRLPSHRNQQQSLRIDPRTAELASVRDALVLVQESWGAQLLVRLWSLGVSRPDAEWLYGRVDSCVLEESLSSLETRGVRGSVAFDALRPLTADSGQLIASDLSPDETERRLPGLAYTARCVARLEADRSGYLLYAPWRLVRDGNVYARWLPGREREIAAAFPGRPVYLLRRAGPAVDAPLRWDRLDSLSVGQ